MDISKTIKKLFHRKHKRVSVPIYALRDWHITVSFFSILAISIAVASLYFYFVVNQASFLNTIEDSASDADTIDKSVYERVMKGIVKQRERARVLEERSLDIVDPSI